MRFEIGAADESVARTHPARWLRIGSAGSKRGNRVDKEAKKLHEEEVEETTRKNGGSGLREGGAYPSACVLHEPRTGADTRHGSDWCASAGLI